MVKAFYSFDLVESRHSIIILNGQYVPSIMLGLCMSSVNCKEHARLTAHNNDAITTLSKVSILGAVHASFYNVKNIPFT